jgi:YidC/Oxa1 family membrane protein insertase
MQQKNQIIAMVLCFLILVGGIQLTGWIWPTPKKPPATEKTEQKAEENLPFWKWVEGEFEAQRKKDNPPVPQREGFWQWAAANAREEKPVVTKPQPREELLTLGDDSSFLRPMLSSHGAAVIRIILPKFQQADRTGLPVWLDNDKKKPKPLELITSPSYVLYHFDPRFPTDDRPLDTLGKRNWELIEPATPEDGKSYSRAVFQTEIDGVRVTKTFEYDPTTYHLDLRVRLERASDAPDNKKLDFRYQLTSGNGMPLEGEWYTSTFRNALVGRVDKNNTLWRDFQDLRFISVRAGGNSVTSDDQKTICYAGVVTQFFASVIAVDDADQASHDFIRSARPTMQLMTVKGNVTAVDPIQNTFVVTTTDKAEFTFHIPSEALDSSRFANLQGTEIGIAYRTDSRDRNIVVDILHPDRTNPLFLDDITVRVNTVTVEIGDKPVTHMYVLYNGPVKVRLLNHLDGDADVNAELVDRYLFKLHLNTLTDYHFQGQGFPSWFGENVSSRIKLTTLLVSTTNVMHAVLTQLHRWVPGGSYGICIILLTIMVRGLMFPLSRKQALMSVRMQELQPEITKLKEKYKDDKQGMGMAQMELFRKHKVSPLGTCWVAFLQMPIFLGLYYALQESIHFRLAPFLWIQNLAAPDMLFYWGENIPWISWPSWYGTLVYLGPFFNILPVVAVALMMVQQSMMAPPTTDETQAMQQKMMKYMMIFFGVMFYKVAAGLCIYFIASSVWGFTERKLLPKRKKDGEDITADKKPNFFQKTLSRIRPETTNGASTAITPTIGSASAGTDGTIRSKKRAARNKRKDQANGPAEGPWQRFKDWWAGVLKQASKK